MSVIVLMPFLGLVHDRLAAGGRSRNLHWRRALTTC
jgi:hypothetical protein